MSIDPRLEVLKSSENQSRGSLFHTGTVLVKCCHRAAFFLPLGYGGNEGDSMP